MTDFTERRPYNAVTDFVDANVARGHGARLAFDDGTRTLTFAELQQATCRFAGGLGELGLRPESRIALLMLDTVDFPVAFWGAIRAGVVCIPLNTLLNAEQYAYMLGDSRVEAVLVSAPLAKTIAPIVDRLPQLRMSCGRRRRSATRSRSGSTRRAPPGSLRVPSTSMSA